jgi:hypothetical protein
MKLLEKIKITQQQALDLLADLEAVEELLVTAIGETAEDPVLMSTDLKASMIIKCNTVSAQTAFIAKNLRAL